MRAVNLTPRKPEGIDIEVWLESQFQQINEASLEQDAKSAVEAIDFDESAVTEVATFDPAGATLADVRNVLATFLLYLRRGGPDKSQ